MVGRKTLGSVLHRSLIVSHPCLPWVHHSSSRPYFLISCLCACPAASQSPCFCSATAVTEGPYPMRAPEPSCVYGVLARIMCNVLSTRSRSVLALVALLPLSSISFVPGPSEKETVQANTPQILFQVSCLMLGANKAHVLVTKREHS